MKQRAIICTALCCTLAGTAIGFAAGTAGLPAIADLFGDINADGEINASDASDLLQFCAFKGSGGEGDLKTWLGSAETTEATTEAPSSGAFLTAGKVEARTVLIDYNNDGTMEVADGYDFYLVCDGTYSYCDVECTVYDADPDDGYTQTLKMKGNELKLTAGSCVSKVVARVTPYQDGTAGEAQTYTWSFDDPFTGSVTSCKIEPRAVYVDYNGDGVKERADGDDYYIVAEGDYDFCSLQWKGYSYEDDEGSAASYLELIGSERKLCAGSSIYKLVCEVTPVKNGIAGEAFTVEWVTPNS